MIAALRLVRMKRDARANLIFLGVLLALVLPGGIILFKRKVDPAAPPLFMPDFVRRRLPYMASQMSPETAVTRYVPELTGQWVETINRERGGGAEVLLDGRRAIISDDRLIQVISIKQGAAGGTAVGLLVWDIAHDGDPSHYGITASVGGKEFAGTLAKSERVAMPLPVKKELMYSGVIEPPATVTWLCVEFEGAIQRAAPWTLRVVYNDGQAPPVSSAITLPAAN